MNNKVHNNSQNIKNKPDSFNFKFWLIFSVIVFSLFATPPIHNAKGTTDEPEINKNILFLLGNRFGNAYYPFREEFESRNYSVSIVGTQTEVQSCRNRIPVETEIADITIGNWTEADYDNYSAVIIPPGQHHGQLAYLESNLEWIKGAYDHGLVLASFCISLLVLAKCDDILNGVNVSYYANANSDIVEAGAITQNELLVADGQFVTGGQLQGGGFEDYPYDEFADMIITQISLGPYQQDTGGKIPGYPFSIFGVISLFVMMVLIRKRCKLS